MLLVAAATKKEIKPIQQFLSSAGHLDFLVTGMGPVATAANLSSYLALQGADIHGVLNIGVGGAYVGSGLDLLDICLARQEVFGDFGICMRDEILEFEPGLSGLNAPLILDDEMAAKCKRILKTNSIEYKEADFVTVSCCSGTEKRGEYLRKKFNGGCENMEGAAVTLVCKTFNIPCVEMRCISNMVLDRNTTEWMLEEAIDAVCRTAELVLREKPFIEHCT